MAKALNIQINGRWFAMGTAKVERKKLYGWTELRALTPQGVVCHQAGLDAGGVTIVTKGSTKVGILREDGCWMDKAELTAVHADGTQAQVVASSFDAGINLDQKAPLEQLMDLIVTSAYQLSGDDAALLATAVGQDIYTFPFSYRGGYEASMAYLLVAHDTPFILVGEQAQFDYISLEEQGVLDDEDDDVLDIDEDELDFGLM